MKIIEKKSKKSTYILDLIIEKKDYVEKVDSNLKNYRKKVFKVKSTLCAGFF